MNLILIKLRAIHPQQNIRRFYSIRIGQDLFKKWHVVATYGRLGTDGRLMYLFLKWKGSIPYWKLAPVAITNG